MSPLLKKELSKIKLGTSLLLCVGGGWLTGLLTESSLSSWYALLKKPAWTPPNFIFPLMWTFLYTLMAISLWLVWMSEKKEKRAAFFLFGFQLFLNFIWSGLFFYLRSPLLGLIDISFLWVAIGATIFIFKRFSFLAASLLIPYFLWTSYALSLNFFIWRLN